jgi:hypothetical protein
MDGAQRKGDLAPDAGLAVADFVGPRGRGAGQQAESGPHFQGLAQLFQALGIGFQVFEKTALDMGLHQQEAYLVDAGAYSHELRQHLFAGPIFLHHSLNPADLTFDTPQADDNVFIG